MSEHNHTDQCASCNGASTDEVVGKYAELIKEHGWAACAVFDPTPSGGFPFIYTIGLQGTYGHPELVMYGLNIELMHSLLADAVELIKEGQALEPGTTVDKVLGGGFAVAVVKVDEPLDPRYSLNMATWFTERDEIEAVQLVWPGSNHLYPWDSGVDSETAKQAVFGTFQKEQS